MLPRMWNISILLLSKIVMFWTDIPLRKLKFYSKKKGICEGKHPK